MKKTCIIILLIAFLAPTVVYAQNGDQSSQGSIPGTGEGYNPEYNILPITLALVMFYLISYLLYDNKNIRKRTYKQIWSIILVGSFLISGITGIILILVVDYGARFHINLLFLHVETGIILAVVSIFHLHIHWRRFKEINKGNT